MDEAARFLMDLASSDGSGDGRFVPGPELKALGEFLADELRSALNISCPSYNGKGGGHSPEGAFLYRETGELQEAVGYEIIDGGVRLGYDNLGGNSDHQNENYGETWEWEASEFGHDTNILGVMEIMSRNIASFDDVFGVGNYSVVPEPFMLLGADTTIPF